MIRVPVWLYVTLFWLLLFVIYGTQLLLVTPRPPAAQLRSSLIWWSTYYLTWAPVTLLIWRLSRSWDLDRLGWKRFLIRHVALGLPLTVLHSSAVFVIGYSMMPAMPEIKESFSTMLWAYVRGREHLQLLIYAAVVAAGQAMAFHRQYRERQVVAARLEAQLSAAKLDTLRARLQPHFLFNSLHSIASLARAGDNAGAVRLISGLSDLLRHLLDTSATHHTAREELTLVEQYLDIQRVRFGDRLDVSVTATLDAAAARVPLLVVQPLVENSLRHGFASRIAPGHIAICARRERDALVIDVVDDGIGLPQGWSIASGNGTGLRTLASRLEAEYGDRQSLSVAPRQHGGVHVTVRLPYEAA